MPDDLTTEGQKKKNKVKRFTISNTKDVIALVSTIIGVASALWALFVPIANYLRERERDYEVKLSSEMIKLVEDLDDSSKIKVDNAILTLSAYEMDAMPYLLYKLEETGNNVPDIVSDRREVIIRSIQLIKSKDRVDDQKLIDLVLSSAQLYFTLNNSVQIDPKAKDIIYSYVKLLSLIGCERKGKAKKLFDEMKNEVFRLKKDTADLYFKAIEKQTTRAKKVLDAKC